MQERRSTVQLVASISSILSVVLASVSLLAFVQSAEKRLTTMEIRIEVLTDTIKELKTLRIMNGK